MTRLLLAFSFLVTIAIDSRTDDPDDGLDRWMPIYTETAASISYQQVDDPELTIALSAQPLLKYTNPVRGVQQHGAIYLWTAGGRPAVIGSVWSMISPRDEQQRRLALEWHSLTDKLLTAERDGELLWESAEPGVRWISDIDLPAPARSRALRLTQMRAIAGYFDAALVAADDSQLRLMTQPLFRYGEDVESVVDGALFSYVIGTDPELLLLIEAREAQDGQSRWQVAFARFGRLGMRVQRSDREVWSCEEMRGGGKRGTYFLRPGFESLPRYPK